MGKFSWVWVSVIVAISHATPIQSHVTTKFTLSPPKSSQHSARPPIQLLETSATFPLDPSDGDFMCRGVATEDGYAQPCDMYVALPFSTAVRHDTNGFSFLHAPGYIVRLTLVGLPGVILSAIMMYCSISCCCRRRKMDDPTERCAHKCVWNLSNWKYEADDPNMMPLRGVRDFKYPRKGITNSPCFQCFAPLLLTACGLMLLGWTSTAAFSGIESTGTGFCALDASVRNYADTLESTRDAYSLVDPNVPPVQLGDVNATNGPTPPELLNELVIALRKGVENIEGWCPSHGNNIPTESTAYDDASPTEDKRNDNTPQGTASGEYGSKLAHEPMVKFFLSAVILCTLFPLVAVSIGYVNKSRPSFRAAMRSGTLSLSLICLLMSTALVIGTIESDTCPTITNRIENDLLKIHANQDPFVLHQMSLMVRCNTMTMSDNATTAWTSKDPNDSLWSSELNRIRLMLQRTKEEQKARAETPSSDETSQEKSESADAVNVRVRHQEALINWLERTVDCQAFSTGYANFLVSVCGTGFGWFEQCAVACMCLSLLLGVGMCCVSSAEYLVEQEHRRGNPEDLPTQTHSALLGGDKSKKYWPSL